MTRDMARTLILGGGFGGLTVATELRRSLGDQHEIVVIDRREHFVMGLRKLWVTVGQGTFEEGRRRREDLNAKGIRFLREDIVAINPATRNVETDRQTLDADHLTKPACCWTLTSANAA